MWFIFTTSANKDLLIKATAKWSRKQETVEVLNTNVSNPNMFIFREHQRFVGLFLLLLDQSDTQTDDTNSRITFFFFIMI